MLLCVAWGEKILWLIREQRGTTMLKIYICPECGWLRTVSRRKDVECHRCGNTAMELTKLDYEAYARMSEQERADYVQSWRYIHKKTEKSD